MRIRRILAYCLMLISVTAATGCNDKRDVRAVNPDGGQFRIDAGGIGREEVRFYSYNFESRPIIFMAARSASGEIKTVFDACVSCYANRMGYKQDGGSVICVYCGNKFSIESLDDGAGSCYPVKIEHRLEGDWVLISQDDIEEGAKYF